MITLLSCPSCGGCSASKMPTQCALDSYYAGYYSSGDRRTTIANPVRFARHVTRFMRDLRRRPKLRILDFGGGDGSLSAQIVRQIRAAANLEIAATIDLIDYEAPASLSDAAIEIRSHKVFPQAVESYDLILASAILEHVPDAYEAIKRLLAAAGPGTFMYVRTPYIVPLARIMGRIDITYPAHVHDMGSRFWTRFATIFSANAELIHSAPSIVESTFEQAPLRTAVAHLLKFPARAELLCRRRGANPAWPLVGGWESVFRFR